jgi:hypothetical protein
MRKNKIFAFLLFISLMSDSVYAACDQPVNKKKVVLFVDFNGAYQELLAAERAACARGESFEVVPSRQAVMEAGQAYGDYLRADEARIIYCDTTGIYYDPKRCAIWEERYDKASTQYENIKSKYSYVGSDSYAKSDLAAVKLKIKQLERENRQLTSIVVSGHHGSMGFYGDVFHGGLGTIELLNLSHDHPKVFENLHSFMAWGCSSVTPFSVSQMKSVLPELKVVAGYINQGPLSIRPKSSQYLEDILTKEAQLRSTQSESDLKAAINGVNRIQETFAGVYVNNACGNDYFYSIRVKEGDSSHVSTQKNFGTLKSQMSCEEFNDNYYYQNLIFQDYFSGAKSIPKTSDSISPLRMNYLFFRDFQHCLASKNLPLSFSDRVGLLLFFHGVQANFEKVFKDQFRDSDRELKLGGSTVWSKKFAAWDQAQTEADLKLQEEIKNIEEIKKQKIAALPPFLDVERTTEELIRTREKLKPEDLRVLSLKAPRYPLTQKIKGIPLKKANSYLAAKEENERALKNRTETIQAASLEWDQKIKKIEEKRIVNQRERNEIKKNQGEFLRLLSEQGDRVIPEGQKLTDLNRTQINKIVANLDRLTTHPALASVSVNGDEFRSVRQLKSKMQRYLVDLDPECMGFLEWHAEQADRMPKPLCN